MLKVLSAFVVSTWLALVPAAAAQQRAPKKSNLPPPAALPAHEVGFDLAADYAKLSGTSGGLQLGFPVDARLTILSESTIMWEPRLSFLFSTIGTTTYTIVPGVNAIHQLRPGTGPYGLLNAPYVTAGAAFNFANNGVTSSTQLSLNAGVGTRVPYGSAALRYEGFLSYTFSGGGLPSSFAIGVRAGLSLWH
ncbi:MAG TPA: hypothetical protein VN848_12095 [Gemmatimonadales bacterium]|nr:hypothetical protein [Gemmatimonadales bacterium]